MERVDEGLWIAVPAPPGGKAGAFLRPLILYIALSACLWNMLGFSGAAEWAAALLPGAVGIGAFASIRRASLRKACALLLGAGIAVWLLLDRADGLAQLANRLFALSEARQSYVYAFFPASGNAAGMLLAAGAASLTLGALCGFLARRGGKGYLLFLLALIWGAQIYFGVFAGDIFLLLLFAAIGIALDGFRGRFAILLLGSAAVALALSLLLFPASDARLAELSEHLRDQIGPFWEESVAARQGEGADGSGASSAGRRIEEEALRLREANQAGPESENRFETLYDPSFSGARAGMAQRIFSAALALIAVSLLLLLIPAFRFLRRARERRRLLRQFDRAPCAEAIDGMFRNAMRWLRAAAQLPREAPYAAYSQAVPWLKEEGFSEMLELWESAAYGELPLLEQDRARMGAFRERVLERAGKEGGRWMRLQARWAFEPPAEERGKSGHEQARKEGGAAFAVRGFPLRGERMPATDRSAGGRGRFSGGSRKRRGERFAQLERGGKMGGRFQG